MSYQKQRNQLINLLIREGIINNQVLEAIKKIPRHHFVPKEYLKEAYENHPLPIGKGQTISQPYTVAFMLEALELKPGQKVLEIGTGSGYNAALIAELIKPGKLYTAEIYQTLIKKAKSILKKYSNIKVIKTDGSQGYQKEAPYDRIISTAAGPEIPKPWLAQLKEEGLIIAPIGTRFNQIVIKAKKIKNKLKKQELGYFQFVPLKGEYGY